MLNANAKKWVKALRSGEYKQGNMRLRSGDEFCCLGVACDLYGARNGKKWQGNYFMGNNARLPEAVKDWLGLASALGVSFGMKSLAMLNDAGASFSEIADIIESEPEGLFK
jgi:hypothetical protein